MLDIPDVILDPLLHLPQLLGLPAETAHLRPAGDTRLDQMAHHILVDQPAVVLRMLKHMRTRPHHRHVTLEHIDELRQLVDARAAQKFAQPRLSGIVFGSLESIGLSVDTHRAELPAEEILTAVARTHLLEKHRTRRTELHRNRHRYENQRRKQQESPGKRNVKRPLHHPVGTALKRIIAHL